MSNYFATIDEDGKIGAINEALPAQDLLPNQVLLTKDEFYFLRSVWGDLEKAKNLITSIEEKLGELDEKSRSS